MNDAGSPLRLVDHASLSIGDLAERTGVTTATLRIWETRYGFPEPLRRNSGHRRYRESDVELVRQVVELRESGLRLDAAIEAVSRRAQSPEHADAAAPKPPPATTTEPGAFTPSVFATLRQRHPQAVPQRLRKDTLRRLSWAIEDEFCARARPGSVYGFFQREQFYRSAADRWAQIALLSGRAYAFAEFGGELPESRAVGGPHLVDLPPRHVMTREWVLVCDVAATPAALVAWELPGQAAADDTERSFEAIWSVDPVLVRDAARACAAVAASLGAPDAAEAERRASGPPEAAVDPLGVTSLFNRVLAYADAPAGMAR
jgi:MerR family transcriptional regulator, light-induced transcriptional regulator